MRRETIVLFDLEETLIEDWSNPILLIDQIPRLTRWINKHKPFRAGLLSMAVWEDRDVAKFNRRLRPFIEETFGFTFEDELIFTRDRLLEWTRETLKMPFLDADDFTAFNKKPEMIMEVWRRIRKPRQRLVFLDDTVENLTIIANDVVDCTLVMVDPKSESFRRR